METVTAPAELDPQQLADAILKGWETFIIRTQSRPPYNANNVYASSYHECARHMALNLVAGERIKPFEPNTLANFRRGKDRERNLLADLSLIGRDSTPAFEVIGHEERFEVKDRKGRVVITGKLDCRIKIGRKLFPLEAKSWNTNMVAGINTFEDLIHNPWTEKGAYQLLTYLYADNQEVGFLLLDRHGLPKLLPVVLDRVNIGRVEEFLSRSETAMDAKDAVLKSGPWSDTEEQRAALPPFITEAAVCKMCKHCGINCTPPMKWEGANIITEDHIIEAVKTAAENKPFAKLYTDAWDIVKGALRGKTKSIMPGFVVDGKWHKGKELRFENDAQRDVYETQKARFEKLQTSYTFPTTEGKFVLTVTKLD